VHDNEDNFIDAQMLVRKVMGSLHVDTDKDTRFIMFSHWDQIIGEKFIGHIELKEIRGDTLVIKADHPTWANLFSLQQNKVLKAIQNTYPILGIRRILLVS